MASGRRVQIAVAAVMSVVGLPIVACGDESAPTRESPSDETTYLLPESLPSGWRARAGLAGGAETTAANPNVAVYGDADHQWSGPLLVTTAMDDTGAVDFVADEEIRIEGVDQAWISHTDDGWNVTLLDADRYVFIEGRELDQQVVLRAAGAATSEPVIAEAGLPSGFQELARGSWTSAIWPDPAIPEAPPGGYAVVYGDGDATITLVQSAAPASAVPLVRLDHSTDDADVRGQPALLARQAGADDVLLQWYEPPALVMTVASTGVSEQKVRQFAEGLQASSANEVERLIDGLPREDHR